jgi:hypothetical protein
LIFRTPHCSARADFGTISTFSFFLEKKKCVSSPASASFFKKVHIETAGKKMGKFFNVSFSLFFSLIFVYVSQRGEFKAIIKKKMYKNRVETFLQKKSTETPKPTFCRFVLSRFWAFLGEAGESET